MEGKMSSNFEIDDIVVAYDNMREQLAKIFYPYKGLVFLNTSVGGGRQMRGVKNIPKTAWGGLKLFLIFVEGGWKIMLPCLKNDHPPSEELKTTNPLWVSLFS